MYLIPVLYNSYHQRNPSFEDYRLLMRDIVKYDRNLLASGEIYCLHL